MHELHPDVKEIIITEEQLKQRVHELGQEITRDYQGEEIVMVSVLRGAAIFMADLVREIDLCVEMDYMAISSYGGGSRSSGVVRILKDIDTDIRGRHVIIAEDILDSGLTLKYTMNLLKARNPKSLEVVTLLRKETPTPAHVDCRYTGFSVPDEFIVGYGLDYAERYRNLPYIGTLQDSIYNHE